jgi:hypothetical protein
VANNNGTSLSLFKNKKKNHRKANHELTREKAATTSGNGVLCRTTGF